MTQNRTFTYSRINGINIKFDLTFPSIGEPQSSHGRSGAAKNTIALLMKRVNQMLEGQSTNSAPVGPVLIPAVIFFHGGGLTAGNREFLPVDFKVWLTSFLLLPIAADVLAQGIAFISADYRLLFPCTAHDIIIDIKALFSFIANNLNPALSSSSYPGDPYNFHISPDHLAVAGASAGAYPARLAALYATPKPKCFFSLYGTGGNLLDKFYLHTPEPGKGDLDLGTCARFMTPATLEARDTVAPIADCSMGFGDETRSIPGYSDRLMTLYVCMLRAGRYLDHLTGVEGLGQRLRTAAIKSGIPVDDEDYDWRRIADAIPPEANCLFPQLHIANFPPTYLIHGDIDRAVVVDESIECDRMLKEAGIRSELVVAKGLGHTFDQLVGPEGWQKYAGGVVPFFLEYIATEGMETENTEGR